MDLEAARWPLALGRARDSAALIVHNKGVQLAMSLLRHHLLEVLSQAVHQILHIHNSSLQLLCMTHCCRWTFSNRDVLQISKNVLKVLKSRDANAI